MNEAERHKLIYLKFIFINNNTFVGVFNGLCIYRLADSFT